MAGGRWYGGVDEEQSDLLFVWDDATRNTISPTTSGLT